MKKKSYNIVVGTMITMICIMIVVTYYMIPAKRVGPSIKPIELTVYDVKGLKNAEQSALLRAKVMEMQGVTACSVNKDARLASVTYYPDVINESNIQLSMNFDGAYAISKHHYPKDVKGGCPVSGIQAFLDKIFN